MRILKSAPFDPDLIDGLRLQFADDVVATIPDAVKTADFEAMIAELRRWQHIDEDNAHLIRSLLYAYRKFNEQVWDADNGVTRVAANTEQTKQLLKVVVGPLHSDPTGVANYVKRLEALRPRGLLRGAIAAEVARHEFWSGFVSERLADEQFSWDSTAQSRKESERSAGRAVQHFRVARLLDSQLSLDSYYSAMPSLEASAESLWGLCLLRERDCAGAAQHFRRATALKPSAMRYFSELAQALLTSDTVAAAALTEAEQAIDRIAMLALESGDNKKLADVEMLRRLLAVQRTRVLHRGGI